MNTQSPALLVLSEIFYPEWEATVNGKTAEISRVNGAFRSVLVPGGKSIVELVYRPRSVYVGANLSFIALLVALAGFIFEWRASEAESRPEPWQVYSPL